MQVDDTHQNSEAFHVPVTDIEANDFDLSIDRHTGVNYKRIEQDAPKVIIAKARKLEKKLAKELYELEAML